MKASIQKLIRQLERRKVKLAAERDRLRDLRTEVTEQEDNIDEALLSLDEAIDKLSELV